MKKKSLNNFFLKGTTNATDLTWWTVTLGHLGEIIGHLDAFESLPTFDFSNLQTDLLIYMQKFLFDNGPEALARRFVVK